jgi:hypothetical protein
LRGFLPLHTNQFSGSTPAPGYFQFDSDTSYPELASASTGSRSKYHKLPSLSGPVTNIYPQVIHTDLATKFEVPTTSFLRFNLLEYTENSEECFTYWCWLITKDTTQDQPGARDNSKYLFFTT